MWTWARRDDMYIAILRYGKKHLTKPLEHDEMIAHLTGLNSSWDRKHVVVLVSGFFHPIGWPDGTTRYSLTTEAYFQLLEHDELAAARRSSLIATVLAIVAILISAGLAAYSIWFDTDPVRLDSSPVRDLLNFGESQK